ncbi:MAG: hypothetical protein CEN90_484 [Parcubacteria group bacterium Licking1014_17]|nr:MAG: hypothetical protein CEN90_484 [Parcubacteria group bacterium Licking1014_17]
MRPYENVLLLLRRHWFVILSTIVAYAILLVLPFVLYVFVAYYLSLAHLTGLYWLAVTLYLLFWWYGLFYAITMYLLDVWIVTDHRVIDSEQIKFFDRTVAELNLSKIQDISLKVEGLIPTFLKFGDLEIQTAGAEEKFFFRQIPNPGEVKDVIFHASNEYMRLHIGNIEVHDKSTTL